MQSTTLRKVPIAWEPLEDAFENNAPEVHSYLHLITGEVIRVVDGVADPAMHARIAADMNYQRIEAVSSREQYRWMERFNESVLDDDLRRRLNGAIDGKGAFRRFKDLLMNFTEERERWFTFRSERLRQCMEAWLATHGIEAIVRPEPVLAELNDEKPDEAEKELSEESDGKGVSSMAPRQRLREIVERVHPADLSTAVAYVEFLVARRASGLPMPESSAGSLESLEHQNAVDKTADNGNND
ncbi:MAG: hypothetical protein IPJ88_14975 [Myxococcales bacterium]|nr:MAG: hypothetical protein IPJ88_14975 [Myxococcales bacterium]